MHKVAFIILVIGGLNWLLSVLGWEVGSRLLGGSDSTLSTVLYVLVGLSAIYEIATHGKRCKKCKPQT